jgi:hypothetical protein
LPVIVQEAMRRTFKDAEFHREYCKVVGGERSPTAPTESRQIDPKHPRGHELIDWFKFFSGASPSPPADLRVGVDRIFESRVMFSFLSFGSDQRKQLI